MTVGYGGVGLTHSAIMANIDNALPGNDQFYSTPQTAGTLPFNYGFVRTYAQRDNNYYQVAYEILSGSRIKTRLYVGGQWQAWKPVMFAGDFGVGANVGVDYPSNNFNNAATSGLYRWNDSTTGAPIVSYGTTLRAAYEVTSGNWTESIQSMVAPRQWLRSSINTSVSAFAEVHTTYNSQFDPALNTGGLMSATMVSGWRVEKFANGVCIVTGSGASASYAINQYSGTTIAIPSVFYAEAEILPIVAVLPAGNENYYPANAYLTGGVTTLYLLLRNGSTGAQVLNLRIKLIGRWKA